MNVRFPPRVVTSSQPKLERTPAPAKPAASASAKAEGQTLTVDLGPDVGVKTYHFPTRFHDVDLMSAQFSLPSSAVAKWLPKGLEPASTLGVTKGLVTFQHLGNPEEMSPYSEAQFAVRVKGPGGKEAWHVLEMPVDSLENRQRGKIIFGYPKEMSKVEMSARAGSVTTPDGTPLFSVKMGLSLPFGIHRKVDNEALQVLNGELVKLSSSAEGKMIPGFASVEFSSEMRRRYPGLPERPFVRFGGRLDGGELSLGLPSRP